MNENRQKIWLTLILVSAAVALYYGWRLFWFMTDDALIAFRYVSNSILGFGYTWNPPPFRAVEGYTSFLWVALLDYIWRWFGTEPPQIVNYLSLVFSALTLWLTTWIVMRMKLSEQLSRFRLLLLALILLGILSNRSFLAWTSSGLETAMFNFFLTLWIFLLVMSRQRNTAWMFGLTMTASLVYLTRPDGLLILAATGLIVLLWLRLTGSGQRWSLRIVGLLPLVIPIAHITWRRITYGEWLPNTYYAKHVAAWPEAGLRYLASFVIEYGLWFWLALALGCCWRWYRAGTIKRDLSALGSLIPNQSTGLTVALLTIAGHVGYYTLIIGGDHFEYRVFSYLIPLIFISAVWMLNKLVRDQVIAAALLGLFILISWPLPWTHWTITKDLNNRTDTWIMKVPVEPEFPVGLKWYARSFDKLQAWLIDRHVCMRHQEHKVFYQFLTARYPQRSLDLPAGAGDFPVASGQSVGVPGWVFPRVAVLDAFGLNDYVIARHQLHRGEFRQMAHDRFPPPGYLESFSVNYGRMANETSGFMARDYDLTADEIVTTEQYWTDRIVHGRDVAYSYAMLNRIAESYIRTADPGKAAGFLEQAIALEPTRSRAFVNLGEYYSRIDRVDSSLALLRVAHQLDADDPLIQTRLGRAYAAVGYDLMDRDPETAQTMLDSAGICLSGVLAFTPDQVEALVAQASILLYRDQIDSSAVLLAQLEKLEIAADDIKLLGDRYLYKDRRDLALRAYRTAIGNDLNQQLVDELLDAHPELNE